MDHERIKQALSGPIASMRTPFNPDDSIDYQSLQRMVDFFIQAGSRALLITIGDSIFTLLSDREIADITRAVVQYSAGRAVVIACTDRWATPQAVKFAAFCREVGADVLQVFLPHGCRDCSTPDAIVKHYAALAGEIPLAANSADIWTNCAAEGPNVARSLIERVANVIAMKADVMGNFDRKMMSMVRDRWTVFAGGQKEFHMELLPYGCQGYLSTFITFRPEVTRAYWRAISANDISAAVTIIERIDRPFFDYILNSKGGFDAAMHGIMELSGLAQRWRRKPFYSLADEEMERLSQFLNTLAAAGKGLV